MKSLPDIKNSTGQALLLILLSMAVVLTIVLSILSRTITDVAVISSEDEALRAFSAAEAGVEQALIIGANTGTVNLGDAAFSAQVSEFSQGAQGVSFPTGLFSGEGLTTWFVDHDEDGNFECSLDNPCFTGGAMKVCWGKEGTPADGAATPAVEVSIFYLTTPGDFSTTRVAREAVDPNTPRRTLNSFSAPDAGTCQIAGETFEFQKTLDFSAMGIPSSSYLNENGLQFGRITLFYNTDVTHQVGVDVDFAGNSILPSQGIKIESLGTSGDANRRIEVFQSYGEIPPVLDAAVFSPGGITK